MIPRWPSRCSSGRRISGKHGRRPTSKAMPDDGNTYEVLDGRLIVTPPPDETHQGVGKAIVVALNNTARGARCGIASSSTRKYDAGDKAAAYAYAGIPWVLAGRAGFGWGGSHSRTDRDRRILASRDRRDGRDTHAHRAFPDHRPAADWLEPETDPGRPGLKLSQVWLRDPPQVHGPGGATTWADHVQVRLLGPVDVTVGGVARSVSGLRRQAVLAMLALRPGEVVSTDRLIDVVWGETAPVTARNTLQSHVSYLRQVLGAKAAIRARAPGYVLNLGVLNLGGEATDVAAAESLIRQGRQSTDPTQGVRQLRTAVALWRGPPLAEVARLAWFDGQARRLDHLLLQAQQALIEARIELGEHAQLLPDLESMARQHPLHEHIHAQLMLALYRTGRQADALATYQRLRHILSEELGIDPSQPLRDLEAAILRQDAALDTPSAPVTVAPSPAVRSLPAQLPVPATPLLGRDAEIETVASLLASSGNRLVTLTGPGGVGKTRLALQAAARLGQRFGDAVAFVSLAALGDPGPVLSTIAAALGVHELGTRPLAEVLYGYLRTRRVLLVLDNVEHLLAAAPQIADMLAAAPGLAVLATSRSPLHLRGEQVYPVPALVPAAAVELFMMRAGQAGADPAECDAEVVGRICRRLDHLPLAIELAAAYTRVLTPAALLAHLDPAMSVLGRGGRDLPERQRTMRHTVGWSYDLLTSTEQAIFRAMAVFRGGWTLDAAAAVGQVDQSTSLELHRGLVDASLITRGPQGAQPRFEMLETIRSYATERLQSSGEEDAVRDRHAGYYRDRALSTATQLWSPAQPEVLDCLDIEHDNVRRALRRLLDRGALAEVADVCLGLSLFWTIRGYWREGQAWADEALAIGATLPVTIRAKLYLVAGWMRFPRGQHGHAAARLAEAARLTREAGDLAMLCQILPSWVSVEVERGRLQAAAQLMAEIDTLNRQLGDIRCTIYATIGKAKIALACGHLAEVDQLLTTHATELRTQGMPWILAVALGMHGGAALQLGDRTRADAMLRESVLISARLRDPWTMMHQLICLADAAALQCDPYRAAMLYGAVDALIEQTGATIFPVWREFSDRCQQTTVAAIGSDTVQELRRHGRQLPINDVVALAAGDRPG
jgi:predicted ATPase/DNA-binding SARP family transcriptional activator